MSAMKAPPLELASACALLLLLPACSRSPQPALAPALAPAAALARGEVFQSGTASWYGADFHGRTTADGEVYDMHKLTAAHPDLPFHTLVEVENLENGRRVLVRINDRGPFLKGRVIDLSLEAARRLDIVDRGTAAVSLRVVRRGEPGGAPSVAVEEPFPAAAAAAPCRVQAGAFSLRENAEELQRTLEDSFPKLEFRTVAEDGLFKVVSRELASAAECGEALRRLEEQRLPGFIRDDGGAK